jgi:hypothetical protein
MTFFNKKTEVMQIEMTPYGRYLYSIGKFKPHSYEFVDDDVLYRQANSGETQESAHSRILNDTPKLKINRAFQDEAPQAPTPATISDMRVMERRNNLRQTDLYSLGRSAYSGSNIPTMQATMLQGSISGSSMTHTDSDEFVEYFFSIQVDNEIPAEELCKAVDSLEINSQFLDEELICPDQRTDRFNIYSTRVSPEDLEDCD